MPAEVLERRPIRRTAGEMQRRRRQQHLPAVAGGTNARRFVHRETHVIAVSDHRFAGV